MTRLRVLMGLAAIVALIASNAIHADDTKQEFHWKLTAGDYRYDDYSGTDINLRWNSDDTHAWIGAYHDRQFGSQSRAGFDTSIELTRYLQLQPSLQLATRGFLGGSLNLQFGGTVFGVIGLGRTNLKPYFNLNFDPNDAVTYGMGYRYEGGQVITAFAVIDNRLGTHQQDWHLNARLPVNASRLTLDVLYKQGTSDVGPITAWGYSATWDWPRWFLRLARDPYQNFSAQDAWRFAAGVRFGP